MFLSFQANFCPFLSDFKFVGFSISKSLVLIGVDLGIGQRSRRYKIFGQEMHTSLAWQRKEWCIGVSGLKIFLLVCFTSVFIFVFGKGITFLFFSFSFLFLGDRMVFSILGGMRIWLVWVGVRRALKRGLGVYG